MGKNTWKIIGIISIVINILLISGFIWTMKLGNESIDNDNSCYYDVCDVDNLNSASYHYYYDNAEKVCYCYDEYYEIIEQTYLG